MTYPEYLRLRVRELRIDKCLTLDELVERLALPRTTIYEWIKDIPLGKPRSTAGQAKRVAAMQAKYQRLRDEAYAQGAAEFEKLAAQPTFRDFVVLYIAEGSKRNRNRVQICNSDPRVVAFSARWLAALSAKSLIYSIQYHADQDLDELRRQWGRFMGIDGATIVMQRKSNSGELTGRTWRSEFGVLTVTVYDTALRSRLQAWIDHIKEHDWRLH
jgi:predicted DNA-binding transcriptional regulator AlpA